MSALIRGALTWKWVSSRWELSSSSRSSLARAYGTVVLSAFRSASLCCTTSQLGEWRSRTSLTTFVVSERATSSALYLSASTTC